MSKAQEDEWLEFLNLIKESSRSHAGYFSWESDRAIEEKGVVQALCESLEHMGIILF